MTTPVTYKRDLDGVDWVALKAALVADDFDNERTPEQYHRSFANSHLTCLACDGDRIIGTARALSDGVCNAYIVDVWTETPYRHQGIATAMMRQLLADLPGQHVYLFTDDATELYEKLGFQRHSIGLGTVVGKWLGRPEAETP
jgi:predicted GNAT family acetyltransferase